MQLTWAQKVDGKTTYADKLESQDTPTSPSSNLNRISRASDFYIESFKEHRCALEEARGIVAVLISGTTPDRLPERLEVIAEATVTYFGSPRRLFLCSMRIHERNVAGMPCVQLAELKSLCKSAFQDNMPDEGPFMWPILDADVAEAIGASQIHALMGKFRPQPMPCWMRVLVALRIHFPNDSRPFISILNEQIGPSTAYMFARAGWFTQKLWMLAIWSFIALCINVNPSKVNEGSSRRIAWEIFKAGICVWGILVAVTGRSRSAIRLPDRENTAEQLFAVLKANPTFKKGMKPERFKTIFQAVPTVILCMSFVTVVLFLATQLIIYLIYTWGDCLELGCRDPQVQHGFWGWCAEVGTDILIAILFELFFAIAGALAEWVALLQAFERLLDHRFTVEMLSVLLSTIERIGTFAVLAFFFTPQWLEPSPEVDRTRDCSDLLFKESDMFCFGRRLPLKDRRAVFQKAFKGPFVVAPFVGILVKVLIPFVALKLDQGANRFTCCCCRAGECCLDGFFHILSLIFTRDGGNVGCCKYVAKGWPFQDVQLVKPVDISTPGTGAAILHESTSAEPPGTLCDATSTTAKTIGKVTGGIEEKEEFRKVQEAQDRVHGALRQITRKQFEPMGELLEIKMSFLWILFFAPVMPMGVIPTLIARLLEGRTDLAKMLYLRCRVFPEPERLMHYTQTSFNRAVVCGSVGWSAGLSLITYNDNLYKNTTTASIFFAAMVVWLGISFSLMLRRFGNLE